MEEIAGYKAEEVLWRTAPEVFPHLVEQGVVELFQEALEGDTVRRASIPFQTSKGKIGYTSEQYLPLRDRAGEVVGVLVIVEDVTELIKLEQRVLGLQEEIEQRKLVEIAKGILMREMDIPEDASYRLIQKRSRDENRKMKEVAKQIIDFFGMLEEQKKNT